MRDHGLGSRTAPEHRGQGVGAGHRDKSRMPNRGAELPAVPHACYSAGHHRSNMAPAHCALDESHCCAAANRCGLRHDDRGAVPMMASWYTRRGRCMRQPSAANRRTAGHCRARASQHSHATGLSRVGRPDRARSHRAVNSQTQREAHTCARASSKCGKRLLMP